MVNEKKQLARKSVFLFSFRMVEKVLSLIVLIFIQRHLGFEGLGLLVFAMSYVALYSVFSDMGLSITHVKKYNEGLDEAKCNATYAFLKFSLGLVVLFVVLASLFVIDFSETTKTLVIIFAIHGFVYNTRHIYSNISLSKTEAAKSVIPMAIGRIIKAPLKIILLTSGFGVAYIALTDLAAVFIVLILCITFASFPIKKPDWNYVKIYLSFSLPVLFIGIVTVYSKTIDKVMLQYFLGTISVGIYALPEKITRIIFLLPLAVHANILAASADLYTKGNLSRINELSNKATKYVSLTLLPGIIFLLVFTEDVLTFVFGEESLASLDVMRLLLIACYINCIRLPYSAQIVSTGHLKIGFFMNLQILIVNAFLNILFIPEEFMGYKMLGLGPKGAALTFLIAITIHLFLVIIYTNKISGSIFYKGIWKHIISGFLVSAILIKFSSTYGSSTIFTLSGLFTIPLLFFLILYILKEITTNEINFLKDNMNPHRIIKYVRQEFKN